MKKLILLTLMLMLVLMLTFQAATLGDDVDFGGDTGGWDSGGWDSGDSGGWGSDDYDSGDWGGGGIFFGGNDFGGGSGGGSSGMGLGEIILIIVIVFIIWRVILPRYQAAGRRPSAPSGSTRRVDQASLQKLMQKDPNFSAADIEAKVKTWSMMFETAWAKGDMTSCRPFLSDGLYNTYQMQLDMMKQNGEASRTEDMAVMACHVERLTQDGTNEYLDVWMQQKKRTYKVDINDPQKVLKGDRDTTYVLEYRWQLMRSAGSVSQSSAGVRVQECPNCGAQTSVNQSGKCEYCGSTLTSESFDWVLNKVDKLAQTSHK